MNALAFAAATSYPVSLYIPGFDWSREQESDFPASLTVAEQARVKEALALSDLGVTRFNCWLGASFARSGQYWCSLNCWGDVMNGGRDYWYEHSGEQDAAGQEGRELL